MKIGLIDVDSHGKKKKWGATIYPNLAQCKISAYHKAKGDSVEWYTPFEHYDIVYMSKVFNFTPDFEHMVTNADKIIKGGTGYDIKSVLPKEIDDMQPDLSIYPNIPEGISYGFLSRGCPNKCPWCVVPRKEGKIVPYWDIDRVANGNKKVVLMDNNILATGDYCLGQLSKIIEKGYKVDFNQALDARLVNEKNAPLLAKVKWLENRIRFGCDTTPQIRQCQNAIDLICSFGYKGEFFLYTMIGGGGDNNLQECYERIHYWWEKNRLHRKEKIGCGVYPYAQPYRDPDNPHQVIPQWQKDMAGWCNKKMVFQVSDFMEFEPRKGFKCKEYFRR